jgi:hypothetical protein
MDTPSAETYTLQDMLAEEYQSDPLEDALYDAFEGSSAYTEVYPNKRAIELTIDASDIVTVEHIQNYTQHISDVVQKLGAGRVRFEGVLGGSEFKISLVFGY